jgi:hypothetical protein
MNLNLNVPEILIIILFHGNGRPQMRRGQRRRLRGPAVLPTAKAPKSRVSSRKVEWGNVSGLSWIERLSCGLSV